MKKLTILLTMLVATSAWAEYDIALRCSEIIKNDKSDEHWILIDKQSGSVRHYIMQRLLGWDGIIHTEPHDMGSRLINDINTTDSSKYYAWSGEADMNYTWKLNRENLELSGYKFSIDKFFHPEKSVCLLSTVEQVESEITSFYVEERRKEKEDLEREKAEQLKKNKI